MNEEYFFATFKNIFRDEANKFAQIKIEYKIAIFNCKKYES